jgi:coenzyme PQQ precursor peptide PqqA
MQWTTPCFEEVSLAMEVTAYVNTDTVEPVFDAAQNEALEPATV